MDSMLILSHIISSAATTAKSFFLKLAWQSPFQEDANGPLCCNTLNARHETRIFDFRSLFYIRLISINCSPPGARLVRSPSRFSWVLCTTLSRSRGFDLWPIWPHIWLAINRKLHRALIDTPAIWYGVALSESDKTFQARTVICITIR